MQQWHHIVVLFCNQPYRTNTQVLANVETEYTIKHLLLTFSASLGFLVRRPWWQAKSNEEVIIHGSPSINLIKCDDKNKSTHNTNMYLE